MRAARQTRIAAPGQQRLIAGLKVVDEQMQGEKRAQHERAEEQPPQRAVKKNDCRLGS
jgi:hypothetical protein